MGINMKGKYLLMAFLLIAIMTVGAVSASDNITDDLTVEDAVDESIAEIEDSSEEKTAAADEDALGSDYYGNGFLCDVNTDLMMDNPGYSFDIMKFTVTEPEIAQGKTLNIYVNGNRTSYTHTFSQYDSTFYVESDFIGIDDYGDYVIDVYLNTTGSYYSILTKTVHVSYLDVEMKTVYGSYALSYGDDLVCNVMMPPGSTGKLSVTVNGKAYDFQYNNFGTAQAFIDAAGWKMANYTAIVTYSGDELRKACSREVPFRIGPKISYPGSGPNAGSWSDIAVGEAQSIDFIAPGVTNGMVEIRITDENGNQTNYNVSVSNGYASFPLSNLPQGNYMVYLSGQIGGQQVFRTFAFYVIKNSEEFTSGISASEIFAGDALSVNFRGALSDSVYILVDGVHVKTYKYCTQFTDVILGLAVGTHKIRLMVDGPDVYMKTFVVNVKQKPAPDVIKLALKKVKVKKSARKLVLQSTLKINGKAVKGKLIKFKFNKKTYSAKTNYKGIAKVTIKKAVLKKLKAGRKLTYQASYGKTVKKITVKVVK